MHTVDVMKFLSNPPDVVYFNHHVVGLELDAEFRQRISEAVQNGKATPLVVAAFEQWISVRDEQMKQALERAKDPVLVGLGHVCAATIIGVAERFPAEKKPGTVSRKKPAYQGSSNSCMQGFGDFGMDIPKTYVPLTVWQKEMGRLRRTINNIDWNTVANVVLASAIAIFAWQYPISAIMSLVVVTCIFYLFGRPD